MAINCKNVDTEFSTKEAAIKSHLRTIGAIDKFNNLLDYNKYLEAVNIHREEITEKYGFVRQPYILSGNKVVFNKGLMHKIDAINGKFYPENAHLRESIDALPDGSKLYLDAPVTKLDLESKDQAMVVSLFNTLSLKFENAFNISSKIIDSSEATRVLANSATPYRGQAAFYFNNKVYLVSDKATTRTLLHEYAHPLIKVVAKQNPKLFEKLYRDLEKQPIGQYIRKQVMERYPDLDVTTDRFKEEVLVTSLENTMSDIVDNEVERKGFKALINRLLYAIKQIFRKLTSAKDFKKFNENTTLKDLANMMISEDFVVDTTVIDESQYAEFKQEVNNLYKELTGVDSKKLVDAINRAHVEAKFELKTLRQKPLKLRDKLREMGGEKALRYMRDYLKPYSTQDLAKKDVDELLALMEEQQDDFRVRSIALVNSINEVKHLSAKIYEIINDLGERDRHKTAEGITRISFFKEFLLRQEDFIKDIDEILGLHMDANEFQKELNTIRNQVERGLAKIRKLEKEFVLEFVQDSTDYMQDNLETTLRSELNRVLGKAGIEQSIIDKFITKVIGTPDAQGFTRDDIIIEDAEIPLNKTYATAVFGIVKDYLAKRFTKESINNYVEGKAEDLGFLQSLAVPYMSMDDPMGSFVKYVKTELNKAESKSLDTGVKIANKLAPLLEAVGYNKLNTSQLRDMLTFVDTVGQIDNETGEVKKVEIFSYLDKFTNGWRYDKMVLENAVEKAFESGDRDKLIQARQNLWEFEEKYMHRKYKDEYYEVNKMWYRDNIIEHPITKEKISISKELSTEAFIEKQKLSAKLSTLSQADFTEYEEDQEVTQLDVTRQEYNQLHQLYDEVGNPKTGDELKKVLVRIQYRKENKKFYEYVIDTDNVQKDFDQYLYKLAADGITEGNPKTAEKYKAAIKAFWKKNFRVAATSEYKTKMEELWNKFFEASTTSQDLAKLYMQRQNIKNRLTDINGHSRASEYSPEQQAQLKDIEEQILKIQNENKGSLNSLQKLRYDFLQGKMDDEGLDTSETEEFKDLHAKASSGTNSLSKEQIAILKVIGEYRKKIPSSYYVESFNTAMDELNINSVTVDTVEDFIKSDKLAQALKNKKFATWFDRNHYLKDKWDPEAKAKVPTYERTALWTISLPINDEHYQKTTLMNPITGKQVTVKGIPSSNKYGYRKVKDEYRTIPKDANIEDYVGTVISNKGSNSFLPKEYKPGDPNSAYDAKYRNQEYYDLKSRDDAQFKLLEAVKEAHLNVQKDRPNSSKLYLDVPRERRRSNLEFIQSGKAKDELGGTLKGIVDNTLSYFKKRGDDVERFEGFNFNNEALLIETDLQGNPVTKIPVNGLYNMPLNEQSSDILGGLYRYLHSLDEQEMLIKNEPIAKAMHNVFNDPENAIKNINKASRNQLRETGLMAFVKAEDNKKVKALNHFIERTWYGKRYSAFEQENPMTTRIANMMMGAASRSFIAMDMVSALKNRFGMSLQNAIEASAGEYYNAVSFARGRVLSGQAMIELSSKGIYSVGPKSLLVQIMEYMDPIVGKTKTDFGKSTSRNFIKDLFDGSWMYDTRKFMEVEGSLQVLFGMMEHQKVEQRMPDGTVKMIPYSKAFELNEDGMLVLKEGVDPEWGIREVEHILLKGETLKDLAKRYSTTVEALKANNKLDNIEQVVPGDTIIISKSKKFQEFKLRMQGVSKRLNGTSDQFDGPQGEKWLGYRLFMFYKKYATGMFLNRFQTDLSKANRWGDVYNWELGTTTRGYYIRGIQTIGKLVRSMGSYYPLMSSKEKAAVKKMLVELSVLLAAFPLAVMMFGYSGDDPDRFKKMREREKEYGAAGWVANHMLYQLIMVQRENSAFVPLPGVGLDDWIKFGDVTSIVTGPTIKLYTKILQDIIYMATGDEKGLYRQDAGPYSWQEKGNYKLWNHLFSLFGIKGKNYDPVYATKTAEIFENLK
jgi:hypothetical protein